jgi:hypothetical protein
MPRPLFASVLETDAAIFSPLSDGFVFGSRLSENVCIVFGLLSASMKKKCHAPSLKM